MEKRRSNTLNKFRQASGFTLMELVIAMSIVAIMASISMPDYMVYMTKARVSEGLVHLMGCQAAYTEFYVTNMELPSSSDQIDCPTLKTENISNVAISQGSISATLGGNKMPQSLKNVKITLTPVDKQGNKVVAGEPIQRWVCGFTGQSSQKVYLPDSCQNQTPVS